MRILRILSSTNPKGGGVIESVLQFAIALDKLGHSVELLCCDSSQDSWLIDIPVKVHAVGPAKLGYTYCPSLITWLKANHASYDCIIIDGLWQYHGLGTWLALKKSKTPYFVFTHGMLDPWFKKTYPLKHLKKWLYWVIGEYWILRNAKTVLFTCEEEKILARQSFFFYKCNEKVVTLGITKPDDSTAIEQKITFINQFPYLKNKRLLLFISRIHPKKGCDLLIKAFSKIANTDESLHLVIAGPDQTGWQKELMQLADSLKLTDRITWTGMLTGDLKWGTFYASEVFILPSHQENFGIAVVEAMACGLPVLISNKVNIWREIEQDGAGLVADDTLEGATELLEKWLSLSQAQKQLMSESAKQSFLNRFEITNAAESLIKALSE